MNDPSCSLTRRNGTAPPTTSTLVPAGSGNMRRPSHVNTAGCPSGSTSSATIESGDTTSGRERIVDHREEVGGLAHGRRSQLVPAGDDLDRVDRVGLAHEQEFCPIRTVRRRYDRGHGNVAAHPNVRAVEGALRAKGFEPRLVVLPDSAPTAAAAAEQIGCEIGAIANSLVFEADGAPVLVLTSGAHRVDTGKVAAAIGVSALKRASADFVHEHTGQRIGGVAPVGHPAPVRTLIDGICGSTRRSGPPPDTRTPSFRSPSTS